MLLSVVSAEVGLPLDTKFLRVPSAYLSIMLNNVSIDRVPACLAPRPDGDFIGRLVKLPPISLSDFLFWGLSAIN